MNPAKRRTVIAGNWKMNMTPAEATAFINEIKPMVAGRITVISSFVHLT